MGSGKMVLMRLLQIGAKDITVYRQKRGMPHAHILLVMAPGDRIVTTDQVRYNKLAEPLYHCLYICGFQLFS